jgi:biopolymer transport protein ExbD
MAHADMYDDSGDSSGFLPLIDVMLVLLVAVLGVSVGLCEIPPPEMPNPSAPGEHTAVIEVLLDGRFRLDGHPATAEQIAAAWSEHKPGSVLIRGHKDALYKHVRQALAVCKKAGIVRVAEAVQDGA